MNLCLSNQSDARREAQKAAVGQAFLELLAAELGQEEPNVFTNGFKSKAALVRARKKSLQDAVENFQFDAWGAMIDAIYSRSSISIKYINDFSNKRTAEDVRSPREQAIDCLAAHGYKLEGDETKGMYVFF